MSGPSAPKPKAKVKESIWTFGPVESTESEYEACVECLRKLVLMREEIREALMKLE